MKYTLKLETIFFFFWMFRKWFTWIKCASTTFQNYSTRIGSRNINERLKWYIYSLKSTNFHEIRKVSWMKPVNPSNLFKTYKTLERYSYSCWTLPKILTVQSHTEKFFADRDWLTTIVFLCLHRKDLFYCAHMHVCDCVCVYHFYAFHHV